MLFGLNSDYLCDAYLERGVDGSFLARPSKGNPGDFTLSGEVEERVLKVLSSEMDPAEIRLIR